MTDLNSQRGSVRAVSGVEVAIYAFTVITFGASVAIVLMMSNVFSAGRK